MLDESKPIFIQIKEQLEDAILNGSIQIGERVPSTNEFAQHYKINPATAGKGINQLVDEGILFKKRGVGMFVTETAPEILLGKRKQQFYDSYIIPLKQEANKLNISPEEIIRMLREDERK
ncbi:DNA-binding transcriptional regulator YhcF, GntR family [Terribacillus halophilus]|uniref:DNA-binding transcriptional regulator YhcF, GntR family n=1 Tax=Terribacillus halophilus TaxID=361279 RepID=A0A1G6TUW6_9BACI|nr:GntR family transcriptional regulator [Terribacillus halophilus]SDD32878.1 DNA-binding transcriptional regulator YhcF, GntR family [Terribacillus halophilus]